MSELLDSVRNVMRVRHYSYQTEKTYVHWIRQYIFFHKVTHPAKMGAMEVEAFLTHLAVERNVAASTQNQALAALLFLYKEVLKVDLPWLEKFTPAKHSNHVPVVLTSSPCVEHPPLPGRVIVGLTLAISGAHAPLNLKDMLDARPLHAVVL